MKDVKEEGKAFRRATPEVSLVTDGKTAVLSLGEKAKSILAVLPKFGPVRLSQ